MPTINKNLIPTKAPGTLLDVLTGGDASLNVRWLQYNEPALAEILNRPIADVTVRQLVLAKAIDILSSRLAHQTLYPFLIQPEVVASTQSTDVPIGWIWDLSVSLPKKWEQFRLAKIIRLSGTNGTNYTGKLRAIFTANVTGSATEVSIFYADYVIDSDLTYQVSKLKVVTQTIDPPIVIGTGEAETVSGFITFKTLDQTLESTQAFYDFVEPPTNTTDSNADGIFDSPAIYEILDSVAGGVVSTDDFSATQISHGTGIIASNAVNPIPALDSEIQTWLTTFNYPFASNANLTSTDGITIPQGLFKEFNLCVPAGDAPTGDSSGSFYPVYISKIELLDATNDILRFTFTTYNITDTTPSTEPVDFAVLDLPLNSTVNQIIEITPIGNLLLETGTSSDLFNQHFGRGHVVLSDLWDMTSSTIANFYSSISLLVPIPSRETSFSLSSTRLSSFGLSRVPKYTPTLGQSKAMVGSTDRRAISIPPSDENRFVCEQDDGIGDTIDLEAQSGITPNLAIERYGYTGGLIHRCVKLVIDPSKITNDPNFYTEEVLPRLTILLGRPPRFGDVWYNGVVFLRNNGNSWQS